MFTGIIQEVGTILSVLPGGERAALAVETVDLAGDVALGDSVAVNGVCLTVTSIDPPTLTFDVVTETLKKSTLGSLARGHRVNLEGALKIGDRLSGHFVMGHVDGVGEVARRSDDPGQVTLTVRAPAEVAAMVIEKGSVAIDGVSLTTFDVGGGLFSVALVPHTLDHTILKDIRQGTPVNLEADIIARWVAKLLPGGESGGLTIEKLRDAGYG
jgi:riboflavin synthase